MSTRTALFALFAFVVVVAPSAAVRAEETGTDEVDVDSFEFVDVIETKEGSILRGIVTEQRPNVRYKLATSDGSLHVIRAAQIVKITKQRNPKFRAKSHVVESSEVAPRSELAMAAAAPAIDEEPAVVASAAPVRSSGFRLEPEVSIVMPAGDLIQIGGSPLSYRTSFAPAVSFGYEKYVGNVGLTVGGLARYTSWSMPVEIAALASHWTLETHAFGRAALQLGRAMPYAGLTIGADTNKTTNQLNAMSTTTVGFGVNLQAGLSIAATPSLLVGAGIDYHPGTDQIEPGWDASISYFAVRLGATVRL